MKKKKQTEKIMQKKEHILLDAEIQGVIGHAAFDATLPNGHGFVAYALRCDREKLGSLGKGDHIVVEFSPYDMSKAKIYIEDLVEYHES